MVVQRKPGNISNFISSFASKNTELARPCNYEVEIIPTDKFMTGGGSGSTAVTANWKIVVDNFKELSKLRCEQAELPPRAFTLIQQKTYGPLEFYPVQNVYNKSSMTFICSDNMTEKYSFDFWMDFICPSHPKYNEWGIPGVRFDFDYKLNYAMNVVIRQKNLQGKSSYAVVLSEAFPTEIYSMPLSWSQKDDYHRLNVVFCYRYSYSLYDQWNADPNDMTN